LEFRCRSPAQIPLSEPQYLPPVELFDHIGKVAPEIASNLLDRVLGSPLDSRHMLPVLQHAQLISQSHLFVNNKLALLVDGPETYDAMLETIGKAESHIHLETYVFASDSVGRRFRDALLERLAHGIEVKLIYDSFGSFTSDPDFFQDLSEAGADILEWNPVNPLAGGNPVKLPFRNHRKLLIVDGDTAFTGGINITEDYSSSSSNPLPFSSGKRHESRYGWRDTHLRIDGSAVLEFQKMFIDTWNSKVEKERQILDPSRYIDQDMGYEGKQLVRVMASEGGDLELSEVRASYLDAITAAERNIWITQAYFIPDNTFLEALKAAVKRGVDVRLLLPGTSDSGLAINAARAHYSDLLRAGVQIWETEETVLHAKTAVVDNVWSTVGSSNLDSLSFFYNNEINAIVIGQSFGKAMAERFLADIEISEQVQLDTWQRRPLIEKTKQFLSRTLKLIL
ncbi:MAG: cardiolipin synthase, partial [Planctomycetaceae bacterium]|nr:cardiolipin synthase [Planctomycetaceae bacterium]